MVWNRKADHLIGENTRMRIETGNQLYACEFDYKKYIEKRKKFMTTVHRITIMY